MRTYDLYATKSASIEDAKRMLEAALGIRFELHDSSFLGEYYLAQCVRDETMRLIANFNGEEWREEELTEWPILLEVNNPPDPEQRRVQLANLPWLSFIHRNEVEAKKWMKRYVLCDHELVMVHETHFGQLRGDGNA